jgi:hypothetical protein
MNAYDKCKEKNILNNIQFCDKHVPDPRLLVFLQTSLKYTLEENREHIFESIEMTGKAKNGLIRTISNLEFIFNNGIWVTFNCKKIF